MTIPKNIDIRYPFVMTEDTETELIVYSIDDTPIIPDCPVTVRVYDKDSGICMAVSSGDWKSCYNFVHPTQP